MTGEHETTSPLTATHFPHDADIGVRGTGPTLAAAFEQAALAMIAVITDPAKVRLEETVAIECAAPNAELLLLDWLNAIIFEMATRGMIFGSFRVETDGRWLRGDRYRRARLARTPFACRRGQGRHFHGVCGPGGQPRPVAGAVRDRRLTA